MNIYLGVFHIDTQIFLKLYTEGEGLIRNTIPHILVLALSPLFSEVNLGAIGLTTKIILSVN